MKRIKYVSVEILKTKTRVYVNYGNKTEFYTDILPMKIVRYMNEKDTIKCTDSELNKNKTIIIYSKEN